MKIKLHYVDDPPRLMGRVVGSNGSEFEFTDLGAWPGGLERLSVECMKAMDGMEAEYADDTKFIQGDRVLAITDGEPQFFSVGYGTMEE